MGQWRRFWLTGFNLAWGPTTTSVTLVINLFSDTATQPTPGMLQAMTQAPLGDEQRGDDPSVNALQERVASLLSMEAALLVPTATMANQIAMQLHAGPGSEVLCHENSHVYNFEAGGVAANSGAQVRALAGPNGTFDADSIRRQLSPRDPHYAQTRVVVVENTSNQGGGSIWPDAVFQEVVDVCQEHGLKLHIDGARLFNAAVKSDKDVSHWSRHADSVQLCFSKGLGCPFGAVLAGSRADIERARYIKQRFGGALRQAGILAGAMLYALDHHVERLGEDHARLNRLASALADSNQFELWAHETNILYFRSRTQPTETFARKLDQRGVLVSTLGDRLRACTHLGIDDQQIDAAIRIILQTAQNER